MTDGLSPFATKVLQAMKDSGVVGEAKMTSAENITNAAKLPKNIVLNALQELVSKGYAKRKAREKAAGYYVIEGK